MTALVGYITKNDHAAYQNEVESFVTWCDDANLILNIYKTKELIFDFKRNKMEVASILIRGQPVEVVPSYKYPGVHLDSKLDWKENSRVRAHSHCHRHPKCNCHNACP